MIDIHGRTIEMRGPFLTLDVAPILRKNVEDAIDDLVGAGEGMVRSNLLSGNPIGTGQTAAGVTHFTFRGRGIPYGAVFMRGGLSRPPGSAKNAMYSAARRPYIIAAVLETGAYGGTRVRGKWRMGYTQKNRRAIHHTQRAFNSMGRMVSAKFDDLAKGLT
jgi:hypothetical protein